MGSPSISIWAADYQWIQSTVCASAGPLPPTDDSAPPRLDPALEVRQGVARIPITGPIMALTPFTRMFLGDEVTDPAAVSQRLEEALARSDVRSIALMIDSPGGVVDGVDALAAQIRSARQQKPIVASIGAMGASAAYWLASQASQIYAERTSSVGSIGVYGVVVDSSRMAADHGMQVHVIRSGPDKGVGVAGAPISDSQLDTLQEQIDQLAEIFAGSVAEGRGIAPGRVKELATGRSWLGAEAQVLGLVDHVGSRAEAVQAAMQAAQEAGMAMDHEAEVGRLRAELASREQQIRRLEDLEQSRARAADEAYVTMLRESIAASGPTCELEAQVGWVQSLLEIQDPRAHELAREIGSATLRAQRPCGLSRRPLPVHSAGAASAEKRVAQAEAFASVLGARGYAIERDGASVKYRRPRSEAWEVQAF